jgi:hypothetical protein
MLQEELVNTLLLQTIKILGRSEMALLLTFYPRTDGTIDIAINQAGLSAAGVTYRPLCEFNCDEEHLLETLSRVNNLAAENIQED